MSVTLTVLGALSVHCLLLQKIRGNYDYSTAL